MNRAEIMLFTCYLKCVYTVCACVCVCVCMYVPAGKVGKGRMNEVKPVDVNLQ